MADIPQLLPTSLALIVVLGLAYRLALAHAAMSAVSRTRLRSLAEDGVRRAERLGALLARRDGVQASLRLGFSLCVVAAAVAGLVAGAAARTDRCGAGGRGLVDHGGSEPGR